MDMQRGGCHASPVRDGGEGRGGGPPTFHATSGLGVLQGAELAQHIDAVVDEVQHYGDDRCESHSPHGPDGCMAVLQLLACLAVGWVASPAGHHKLQLNWLGQTLYDIRIISRKGGKNRYIVCS